MRVLSFKEYFLNESKLINEGGAFGHLNHPFEDLELTFGDIKEMIKMTLEVGFRSNNMVTEKTDGIQLSVTWKNGEVRFAKQVHTKKNKAETAWFLSDLKDQWKAVSDVMYSAGSDLQSAFSKMNEKYLKDIFKEGSVFLSLEVINPKTVNTVFYGSPLLVFHGLIEYDLNGKPVGNALDSKSAVKLEKEIRKAGLSQQNEYSIKAPNFMKIIKSDKFPILAKSLYQDLTKKMNNLGLKDNDTLEAWLFESFHGHLQKIAKSYSYDNAENIKALSQRFATKKGSIFPLTKVKKIENKEFKEWALNYSENRGDWIKDWKRFLIPIESIFLKIGAELMKQMSVYLAADQDSNSKSMLDQLNKSIDVIRKSDNIVALQKLETELARIEQMGGLDKLVASEGIVFKFKGKLYKLTGLFAPIHQICAMLKFDNL